MSQDTLLIQVTDSLGSTAQATFVIPLSVLTMVTTSPLPSAVQAVAYSTTMSATGGEAPLNWRLISSTGTNSWSMTGAGVLTGTPGTVETDSLLIQVTDSVGSYVQATFTLATNAIPVVATPTFAPAAGTYAGTQTVTISTTTPSATIYYTTNGATPTTSSAVYSTPISVSVTETVKAMATATGYTQSAVASAAYTISTSGLPSAVANLQVINQGGPNNGPTNGTIYCPGFPSGDPYCNTANHNYQALSWLPATQGTYPIASYNIYRATYTNGVKGSYTLYDNMTTPRTITGTIAPIATPAGPTYGEGLMTVSALSGGTTSIANGDLLCGSLLFSSASGFTANTVINYYSDSATGGGGTGHYVVNFSQTASGTFSTWTYQDTQATNCNDASYQTPGNVYAYAVAAVDTHGNVGPLAYPNMYLYRGIGNNQNLNFNTNPSECIYNSTAVTPSSPGPYSFKVSYTPSGGDQPFPVFGSNSYGASSPSQRFELGAFTGMTFDVMVTDSTYQTVPLDLLTVMRAAGYQGSADTLHWSQVNLWSYGTPVINQWATFRVPFSVLGYGFCFFTASFVGTSQYNGTLTVTSFASKTCAGIDGSAWVFQPAGSGSTLADSYVVGYSQAGGTGTYQIFGPNITGTENITSRSGWYTQGTSAYKFGTQWGGATGNTALYWDNIGLYT